MNTIRVDLNDLETTINSIISPTRIILNSGGSLNSMVITNTIDYLEIIGTQQTILKNPNTNKPLFSFSNISDLRLQNLNLNGNRDNQTSELPIGIEITNCDKVSISNVKSRFNSRHGMRITNCKIVNLNSSIISDNGKSISTQVVEGVVINNCDSITVIGCTMDRNDDTPFMDADGLQLGGASKYPAIIHYNNFSENSRRGLKIQRSIADVRHNIFQGNISKQMAIVETQNLERFYVAYNIFGLDTDNSQECFFVHTGLPPVATISNIVVEYNIFNGTCTQEGVHFAGCDNLKYLNNINNTISSSPLVFENSTNLTTDTNGVII